MSRSKRMAAADAMTQVIHDLAQPLGAASLSVDTAALLLRRGEAASCLESIEAASRGLDRSLLLIRILKVVNGGEPSAWITSFDPTEVCNALLGNITMPALAPMMADPGFFEAALAGLIMALPSNGARSGRTIALRRGEVHVTFRGQGGDLPALRFWTKALRKLDVRARYRTRDDEFEVKLFMRGCAS